MTGAMAQQPAPNKSGRLGLRVVSALVLAPPVLAALYFGSPYSDILIILAGGLMVWEWVRICGEGKTGPLGLVLVFTVAATLILIALGYAQQTFSAWHLLVVCAVIGLLAVRRDEGVMFPSSSLWSAAGAFYIPFCCMAFIMLRQRPDDGLAVIFWLVAAVWATDIGAYFVGKTLGGPKLAPRISPKKTWSGLCGGVLAAAIASWAVLAAFGYSNLFNYALFGAILAVVAQAGDLFESALKRRFGVKDSSNLIPGHGGVLDRADGLLSASMALFAYLSVSEGLY